MKLLLQFPIQCMVQHFLLRQVLMGGHVLIGSSFLLVCLYRLINHQFTRHHHFGFEAAA